MKFFIAFAALVAVAAAASFNKPAVTAADELEAIVAAINSPSTDPATAILLEQQLQQILGINPEPISVGPAIVDFHPISVGPAIVDFPPISVGPAIVDQIIPGPISVGPAFIDFPLPDGGAVSAPVEVAPVAVAPAAVAEPTSAPLVQIILNINQADSAVVAPTPSPAGVAAVPAEIVPTPVNVVDSAPVAVSPVQVVEVAPTPIQVVEVAPEPVQVVAPVFPASPIQVVNPAPVPVEPVIVGTPIIPSPAVTLPEELN